MKERKSDYEISSISPSQQKFHLDYDLSEYLVTLMNKYINARDKCDQKRMDESIQSLITLRQLTSWQIAIRKEGVFY